MNGLKFHWSNPKFDGLPWACDRKPIGKKKKPRPCVKRVFSLADVQNETARLRKESPCARWSFKFCGICQSFHIVRMKRGK